MKGHTIRQTKRAKNRVKDRFISQHQALALRIPHLIYNPVSHDGQAALSHWTEKKRTTIGPFTSERVGHPSARSLAFLLGAFRSPGALDLEQR